MIKYNKYIGNIKKIDQLNVLCIVEQSDDTDAANITYNMH